VRGTSHQLIWFVRCSSSFPVTDNKVSTLERVVCACTEHGKEQRDVVWIVVANNAVLSSVRSAIMQRNGGLLSRDRVSNSLLDLLIADLIIFDEDVGDGDVDLVNRVHIIEVEPAVAGPLAVELGPVSVDGLLEIVIVHPE